MAPDRTSRNDFHNVQATSASPTIPLSQYLLTTMKTTQSIAKNNPYIIDRGEGNRSNPYVIDRGEGN